METILGDVNAFLSTIFKDLNELNIDISEMYPDHICYRTSSEEEYNNIKTQFLNYGTLF
ncbi:MAG: VOC family protein, partial [Candidatus Sericytochromatia bacterium]